MTTLTDKFTTLEGQLTTEQIALLAALEPLADVNTNIVAITSAIEAMSSALTTSLTDLFDLLDTVNNNAAGNAQAILAAIAFYSSGLAMLCVGLLTSRAHPHQSVFNFPERDEDRHRQDQQPRPVGPGLLDHAVYVICFLGSGAGELARPQRLSPLS